MTPEEEKAWRYFAGLSVVGLFTGLGVLLASKEVLTTRIIVGRALSSAAMGVGAAGILIFLPATPFAAQVGLACLMASLGTSGLEKLFQIWKGK